MTDVPLSAQLINLFASVILLLAFAMLAQRRVLTLINLFALQGLTLACPPWWWPSPPGRPTSTGPPA
jgi:hypothetical protein